VPGSLLIATDLVDAVVDKPTMSSVSPMEDYASLSTRIPLKGIMGKNSDHKN